MRAVWCVFILLFFVDSSANADRQLDPSLVTFTQDQSTTIKTHTGRDLVYLTDRPDGYQDLPILLLIDGSGCVGQSRPDIKNFYRPTTIRTSLLSYARVRVEKPGVNHNDDWSSDSDPGCSEEFLKHYTIDQRVEDHLRVLQHLRASADWWNGEVYIFGWSDGGDIGTRLTAYYPNVKRAVLGGMGGGIPMAEHFKDDWICSEDAQIGDRAGCLENLDQIFQRIANNPTWRRTWSGEDNSWRVWNSRLFSTTTELLKDNRTPVLIVHGQEDFNSMPVSSARTLVQALKAANNEAFTYWEVKGMEHTTRSLAPDDKEALETDMLLWLLGDDRENNTHTAQHLIVK